ncbi:MAG: alpha/beta hydrolase [Alphaproteobacteria bacterium]|nr:alpha/beta hydrolase [Alphaproteobacteria bacterium]
MQQQIWIETNLGPVRVWKITPSLCNKRIVIFMGVGEFCEKYQQLISFFSSEGAEIVIFDWPGMGQSGNFAKSAFTSHVSSFDKMLLASCEVIEKIGWANKRFFVLGHSMGGHFALRLQGLKKFKISGIIALSPMLLPKVGLSFFVYLLAKCVSLLGFSKYTIPKGGRNTLLETRKFYADNLLSRNRKAVENIISVINNDPSLARSGVSFGWLSAAFSSCFKTTIQPAFHRAIQVPVIIMIGSDEKLVSQKEIIKSLGHIKFVQLISFNQAKHELYNELPYVTHQLCICINEFINIFSKKE